MIIQMRQLCSLREQNDSVRVLAHAPTSMGRARVPLRTGSRVFCHSDYNVSARAPAADTLTKTL
jgi:hypothetical protein